jgi:hypothetical protein
MKFLLVRLIFFSLYSVGKTLEGSKSFGLMSRCWYSHEDGDSLFLRNVDICLLLHTASQPSSACGGGGGCLFLV